MVARDEALEGSFNAAADEARNLAAALSATGDDDGLMGRVAKGIAGYEAEFAAYVAAARKAGLDEKSGLLGALRKSVHGIETELKAEDADGLQVLMLMMRRHEKDFLARIDTKYVDRLDKRVEEFKAALPGSPVPANRRETILARLDAYQKDFHAMADGILAQEALRQKMGEVYTAM